MKLKPAAAKLIASMATKLLFSGGNVTLDEATCRAVVALADQIKEEHPDWF